MSVLPGSRNSAAKSAATLTGRFCQARDDAERGRGKGIGGAMRGTRVRL